MELQILARAREILTRPNLEDSSTDSYYGVSCRLLSHERSRARALPHPRIHSCHPQVQRRTGTNTHTVVAVSRARGQPARSGRHGAGDVSPGPPPAPAPPGDTAAGQQGHAPAPPRPPPGPPAAPAASAIIRHRLTRRAPGGALTSPARPLGPGGALFAARRGGGHRSNALTPSVARGLP